MYLERFKNFNIKEIDDIKDFIFKENNGGIIPTYPCYYILKKYIKGNVEEWEYRTGKSRCNVCIFNKENNIYEANCGTKRSNMPISFVDMSSINNIIKYLDKLINEYYKNLDIKKIDI